mgnify:CR=1 FL=1
MTLIPFRSRDGQLFLQLDQFRLAQQRLCFRRFDPSIELASLVAASLVLSVGAEGIKEETVFRSLVGVGSLIDGIA